MVLFSKELKVLIKYITTPYVIVPVHGSKDIKKGTLLGILKQAGIDRYDV